MITYKNLTIIGTSHIAIESVKEVNKKIEELQPTTVAIELDRDRFIALIQKKEKKKFSWEIVKQFGISGFIFTLIGAWVEKKMGKLVGVSPGTEMLIAVKAAAKCKANVALIDRDIKITVKHLFKYITLKEKLRFLWDLFAGIFFRKGVVKFDLRKVPSDQIIRKMILQVKDRYPSFYKALMKERDEFMAKNLYNLMNKDKDRPIVAIVGAGHENSIIKLIKNDFKNKTKWNTQNANSHTLQS